MQTLLRRLTSATPSARRRQTDRFRTHAELLEIRTLLAANVTAQLIGGSAFLSGTDGAPKNIWIHPDSADPTLIDIDGKDGTTINGLTSAKFPAAQLTGNAYVHLSGNVTLSLTGAGQHATPLSGGVFITLDGGGKNQINVQQLALKGSFYITTGNGDDNFTMSDLSIGGVTSISSGNGDDLLLARNLAMQSLYVSTGAGAADAQIDESSFAGVLSISAGVGSSGNHRLYVFSSIAGATAIAAGHGNNSINVVGPLPSGTGTATVFGPLSIVAGNGDNEINVINLPASSLTIVTGTGANQIDIGAGFPRQGGPLELAGATATFNGPVFVETLGGHNTTNVQNAVFRSSFVVYNIGGQNTLNINDASFNGLFSATMGGTGNTINVERDATLPGSTTFNGLAVFNFAGAITPAGGGTVNLGVPGASAAKARFASVSEFIGAQVNVAVSTVFDPLAPILIFSTKTLI